MKFLDQGFEVSTKFGLGCCHQNLKRQMVDQEQAPQHSKLEFNSKIGLQEAIVLEMD